MTQTTLKGSCLCGAVKYEASGEAKRFYHCHCSRSAEIIPLWIQVGGALALLVMSAKPLYRSLQSLVGRLRRQPHVETCTCAPGTCSTAPLVNIGKFVPADKKKK